MYVAGLANLFPDKDLRPSHHAALHIGDILELFGPVHSHSAPFYERFIHFLLRQNTNKKLGWFGREFLRSLRLTNVPSKGELESTFMRKSSRYSNLLAILADDENVRRAVTEMVKTMESLSKEDLRGSRLASIMDPSLPKYVMDSNAKPFKLEREEHLLLCDLLHSTPAERLALSTQALSLQEISISGVCYGTSESTKFRNSAIVFCKAGEEVQRAGSVQTIFQHTHHSVEGSEIKGNFYLLVREHLRMDTSNGLVDPYQQFGFAGGFLCEAKATALHLIELSQVVSHFALTKLGGDHGITSGSE